MPFAGFFCLRNIHRQITRVMFILSVTALASCSGEEKEPAEVSVDKLNLVFQTLLELPFNLGGGERQTRIDTVNGDPELKIWLYDEEENVTVSITKKKCTFRADFNTSRGKIMSAEINLDSVYMSNPRVTSGDGGWYFGLVQFEDSAVRNFGDSDFSKVTRLGAGLNRGDESEIALWQSRLSALRKYCPGR